MNLLHIIILIIVILLITVLSVLFYYFFTTNNWSTSDYTSDADIKLSLNPVNGYILPYANILNVPDQGILSSCGAVQLSSIMDYYYYIRLNNTIKFSALYLYYYGRMINGGNINIDKGGRIDNYLSSINSFGLATENDWPYITDNYNIQPPKNITIYNPELRWNTYSTNITNIKHSIKSGNPVILDILLYNSFNNVNTSGLVTLPDIINESYTNESYTNESYTNKSYTNKSYTNESYTNESYTNESYTNKSYVNESYVNESYINESYVNESYVNESYVNESYIARHAVSLWGWDDDYNVFIMLNSWGTNKGYNGWYFIPYDYILTPSLSTQFVYNISFMNSNV
jgi:hypothetical protein